METNYFKKFIFIPIILIFIGAFYFYKNETNNFSECNWEKLQSNAEMVGCLINQKQNLLAQRQELFSEFLSLKKSSIDPNFDVPLEDVKAKINEWFISADNYRKTYCEAKHVVYSDGSGYFEGIEMCEIQIIKQDIQFISERVNELKNYSDNLSP